MRLDGGKGILIFFIFLWLRFAAPSWQRRGHGLPLVYQKARKMKW